MKISGSSVKRTLWIAVVLLVCSTTAVVTDVEQSSAQAAPAPRAFPAPPAPYEHPRVFTTAAELPEIKQNLSSSNFGAQMSPWFKSIVTGQVASNGYLRQLADRTFTVDTVTEADINDLFFRFNEGSSYNLAVMSLWGALFVDGDPLFVAGAQETAIAAATNHAILAEHVRDRFVAGDYSGLSAATQTAISRHWSAQAPYAFNLQVIWRNGGVGTALAYDMLYNDMTVAQRDQQRRGLVIGTDGWNFHGGADTNPVGLDGNAVSNHYGYQGDMLVMMAAIYGEEGWSQASWDQGVKVMQNYVRVGFTPAGYPIEDSYGPDLGLREGSRGLIAMARQGVNEFTTNPSEMYNIGVAVAHDIEAVPNGSLIGGESGGNYALSPSSPSGENPNALYPTFFIAWKHLYPDDPTIDHLYRWRVGDNYNRIVRWQSMVDYAFFGQDHFSATPDLDLTAYYPQRGKMIARNDLSDTAVQFAFDARPDSSNIGHDKSGRGHFSLNGLGRRWVTHLNFRHVELSTESSTMHIDGVGQAYNSPSVRVVSEPADDGVVVSMVADLEYAYDWQWNEPWTFNASQAPRPSASDWQPETINPRDFYRPGVAPPWEGTTLWGDPNIGYPGMWMYRRPNLPVQKAFRSVAYVRAPQPYVIITDDIRQDDSSHLYESYLQLPFDLDQMQVNGNDAILSAAGDDRQLLVRVLRADSTTNDPVAFTNEAYTTSVSPMDGRRLIVGVEGIDPQLTIMLWPHRAGDPLPQTSWNAAMTKVTVDDLTLEVDRSNGYPLFVRTQLDVSAGDANCSDSITIADAVMVAQHTVGLRDAVTACPLTDPSSQISVHADMNDDGNITIADAVAISQCIVGLQQGCEP